MHFLLLAFNFAFKIHAFLHCCGSGAVWSSFILASRIRFNETDPDPAHQSPAKNHRGRGVDKGKGISKNRC